MQEKPSENVANELLALGKILAGSVADIFYLAKLEAKLVGKSLVMILGFFLAIILLTLCAWFFLMATLTVWINSFGLNWTTSLALASLVNIFLIAIIALCIKNLRKNLSFTATRGQLGLSTQKNIKKPLVKNHKKSDLAI